MCKTMCLINVVVCNSFAQVIVSDSRRQMRVATRLFLAIVLWVARHLDLKVQCSTKEEDVWDYCHDVSLLAWGVFLWGHRV